MKSNIDNHFIECTVDLLKKIAIKTIACCTISFPLTLVPRSLQAAENLKTSRLFELRDELTALVEYREAIRDLVT